ncbi:hypothetical protein JCM17092_23350 [Haloplanus litoreus]
MDKPLPVMYSISQLKRGISSPTLFCRELNRLYHRRLNRRPYNTRGVDVFAEDWDTLIILDACRYDMFERLAELEGRLESRISRGSATVEFLLANFDGRELLETVYVTSNPQLYRNRHRIDTELHAIIEVWSDTGWDERYGTVLPETVADAAIDAAESYPNKRHVVHFMQPHYPFLTDETTFDKGHLEDTGNEEGNVWNRLMESDLDVDAETIQTHYEDNLRSVLPAVERLLDTLDGKTVVTSDHGNMLGERARPVPVREWGHPRGLYTPELVTVPWLVVEGKARREITAAEGERELSEVEEQTVNERLRQLGYAE